MIIELDFSPHELEVLCEIAAHRHYENEREFVSHILEDALSEYFGIWDFSINTWAKDDGTELSPGPEFPSEIPQEFIDEDLDDDIPF